MPSPLTDESELIASSIQGDRASFATLAAHYRPWLVRTTSVLLGDPAEAEDVTQETLARAYKGLASYRGHAAFSTWLCGIALNICRKVRRRVSRHAKSVDPLTLDDRPALRGRYRGVLSSVLRREISEQVEAAVNRLPQPFKEAFALRLLEDMSYAEIAAVLGVSQGTARVRAYRARSLLRAELGHLADTAWIEQENPETR